MTSTASEDRREQALHLARRLVEAQGIEEADAVAVANKIANSDDDIWSAALRWLHEGSLPNQPEIEGYTPQSLGHRFTPSVAFTALMALRRDPERARSALRHSPADLERRPPSPR